MPQDPRAVSKTVVRVTVPWVRIPPSPPYIIDFLEQITRLTHGPTSQVTLAFGVGRHFRPDCLVGRPRHLPRPRPLRAPSHPTSSRPGPPRIANPGSRLSPWRRAAVERPGVRPPSVPLGASLVVAGLAETMKEARATTVQPARAVTCDAPGTMWAAATRPASTSAAGLRRCEPRWLPPSSGQPERRGVCPE